jgi:hypothetical protein
MSVPQVKDRPTSALRAVFAGIGSLLSGKDKKDKRVKPAAEAPAAAAAPAPTAEAPDTTESETTAESETVVAETVAAEPAAEPATAQPEAAAEPAVVAEPEAAAEPETVAAPESAAAPETTAELPLANYDELTVASLRARLRNLSNDDLGQLRAYEEAHQNRPEVIKMFQNRLIKMTSSMPKLEA